MALIHKQPVHTQLLESNHIVFSVCTQQFIQPCLQRFSGLFHLLNGKAVASLEF